MRPLSAADKLLAAAAELFSIHGYGGTTVEAVARRAGVNKALVSYHFGGKQPLHRAVRAEIMGLLPRARSEAPEPGEGPVRSLLSRLIRIAGRRPMIARWILRESLGDGPPPPDQRTVLDQLSEDLAGLLQRVPGRPAATAGDRVTRARAVLVMLMDQATHQHDPAAPEQFLDAVMWWLEMENNQLASRRRSRAAGNRACLPGQAPDRLT